MMRGITVFNSLGSITRHFRARTVRAALVASAVPSLVRFVAGRYDSAPRTSRRDFLRWTVAGASTFFLAEAAAGFVAFFWPIKIGKFGTKITLAKENIPAVGAAPIKNQDGKFWLINNDDGALALYWKCVHLGCTVPWDQASSTFACPCHQSIYDRRGVRISGPAPRPLDVMFLAVEGDQITVDTSKIKERVAGYDPKDAVKLPV